MESNLATSVDTERLVGNVEGEKKKSFRERWNERWREPIPAQFEIVPEEVARPVSFSFWKIAFAVMVGNLLTAIMIGIFYAMTHS